MKVCVERWDCKDYNGNAFDYHCETCNKHVHHGEGFRGEYCSEVCFKNDKGEGKEMKNTTHNNNKEDNQSMNDIIIQGKFKTCNLYNNTLHIIIYPNDGLKSAVSLQEIEEWDKITLNVRKSKNDNHQQRT